MSPLDLLERVAPHVALFPRWAKTLFVAAMVSTAASLVVYVALHGSAADARAAATEQRDVTVDVTGASGTAKGLGRGTLAASSAGGTAAGVAYATTDDGVTVSVTPTAAYLQLLARGGPIVSGAFADVAADELPLLDVKVTNNSERVVFLTAALVDVASSRPDLTAIPTVTELESTPRAFELGNEGWGPLRNAVLRYRVGPPGLSNPFERPFPATRQLGTIREYATVGVDAGIAAAGVDVARLRRLDAAGPSRVTGSQAAERRQVVRPLGRGAVVYGELEYATATVGSRVVRRRVRVQVPIVLFTPEPMSGGGAVGMGEVYALGLRADGRDYRRVVGIAEALRPADFVRFALRVYAPRSSVHRLVVRFRYGGGEIVTRPIVLRLYVPRSHEPPTIRAQVERS